MKYAGVEDPEQILGEIDGVPARGGGPCQILYLADILQIPQPWYFQPKWRSHQSNNWPFSTYHCLKAFDKLAKVWSVLAIHLKNFTSGESETERLGGGVHLEQSHQLPSQPAWCWEVDWHHPQIQNTGFEIQIHNLHAAEIAWHHKYKYQIYVKYKLPTFLHQVGWPLRGEHYLVPILRTFC